MVCTQNQPVTGIRNLWGTANVFGHKRYMNGAGTNPQFDIVARAAVQIKNALSTGGFSLKTTKNGKGQLSLTLTGHVSIESQSVMPMVFYSTEG